MKKAIILVTIVMSLLIFASCGIEDPGPAPEPAWFLVEVTGDKVFEKGYYCERITSNETLYFGIRCFSEESAEWSVYIVDEELSEEEVETLKKTGPVLTGNGSAEISYGQWVYVFCSVNAETSDRPTKDILSITWSSGYA